MVVYYGVDMDELVITEGVGQEQEKEKEAKVFVHDWGYKVELPEEKGGDRLEDQHKKMILKAVAGFLEGPVLTDNFSDQERTRWRKKLETEDPKLLAFIERNRLRDAKRSGLASALQSAMEYFPELVQSNQKAVIKATHQKLMAIKDERYENLMKEGKLRLSQDLSAVAKNWLESLGAKISRKEQADWFKEGEVPAEVSGVR